ncbi:hypothetical protein CGRA01v4_06594 [Colletotrichum graminicola]|nr:hypothetical protein CGRA01v4_06594 [Colletotrichum graminicola]
MNRNTNRTPWRSHTHASYQTTPVIHHPIPLSVTMAITELVFLPLKANEQVRADFYNKIPSLIRATFNDAGGPMASAVGRVLESNPTNADNHCGYLVVFCWESLDMIKDFMIIPGFVDFRASLAGYVDGPPTLQFFEAPPGIAPEETLQDSTHFFFMKSTGTGGSSQPRETAMGWDGSYLL